MAYEEREIREAHSKITHLTDGPLTTFVLMARACELAAKPGSNPEAIANALHEAFEERDWLPDDA